MSDTLGLARRAVACKHWRWMPGSLAINPFYEHARVGEAEHYVRQGDLPCLTDSATVGCLLALVQEAWGGEHVPEMHSTDEHGGACVLAMSAESYATSNAFTDHPEYEGESLAEALVKALEAAP